MVAPPDFSKEDLQGNPVQISDGVWVLGNLHYPGGTKNLKVNNRTFVFKLQLKESLGGVPAGNDCLFVYAPCGPSIIDGVKKLEKDTGLKAVALMNNGGGHHIYLKLWYESFPDMAIWITPTRVPQTLNGESIRKEYPDRWELVDNTTVPYHAHQLFKYFDGAVDAVIMDQFILYADSDSREAGSWGSCEQEATMKTTMEFLSSTPKLLGSPTVSNDEPVLFHKKSKLILTGHNYEFAYFPLGHAVPKEMEFEGGFFFTHIVPLMFFKPGRYSTMVGNTIVRMRDFKVHAKQWQEVLKWDFEYSTGHHELPTVCGPYSNKDIMEGEGGLKGNITRTLEASGELTGEPDAGSWFPWKSANVVYNIQQKEPSFVKNLGEQPVLPLGGPGYDDIGMKK